MKGLLTWSLRRQLIFLVVISLLPVLGILLYTNSELRENAVDDANEATLRLVQNIAQQHQQNVENTQQLLMNLSRLPEVQGKKTTACNKIVRDQQAANPLYAGIFMATPAGRVFASSLPFVPHSINHRKYYRDVIKTGRFSAGEYVVGISAKKPVFHYASPVFDRRGELMAIVVAAIDLDHYGEILRTAKLPAGSSLAISDHRHRRLYRYPEGKPYDGRADIDQMIARMSGLADEGTFLETGVDGVNCLYAFHRLRLKPELPPYFFIRVGIPTETALAGVTHIEQRNILFLSLVFLLSLSTAWLMANQVIMKRFNRLVDLARKLGRGEMEARSGLQYSGNEIGLLAESLDRMAGDIQERQLRQSETEEALRISEEKFRGLIEATQDLVFTVDREGLYTYLNPRFHDVTGYTTAELQGRPFTAVIAPEFISPIRDRFKKGMAGEDTPPYRVDLICKEAGRVPVEFLTTTLYDGTGKTVGRYGVGRDMTERIRVEQILRESEEKYRTLFERMAQGAVYLDREGQVFSANPAAVTILGQSLYQLMGRVPRDPRWRAIREDGSDYPDEEHPSYRAFLTGKPVRHEMMGVFNPQDNRLHWLLIDAIPRVVAGEEKPQQVFATFTDITALKEAEEATRISENRFSLLFNNMSEGVAFHRLILDEEGRPSDYELIDVNPQYEATLDLQKADVIGRKATDVYQTAAPYLDEYFTAAHSQKPLRFETFFAPLAKYFDISVVSLKEKEFATIFLDITDRKRSEAEKKEMEKRLLQSQKMEAIGTLAGGIAHDFNNILSSMMGYAEMAMDDEEPKRRNKDIEQILHACERARTLVLQILDFSRQTEQKRRPVDICVAVRKGLGLLRASLPATIEIKDDLPEAPLYIASDQTQIYQVLFNLCTNAAHAMRERGGVLTVELMPVDFTGDETVKPPEIVCGHYVKLTVSDIGQGIPPEIVSRIFDPFFTTKGPGEGTGLGLAMIYGIVKSHQGVIHVCSRPGQGTAVDVYLPCLISDGPKEEESLPAVPMGKGRILFVDDEASLVNISRKILSSLGYDVTATASSLEALKLITFDPGRFDILISDLTMPMLTGVELAREALSLRPNLPVILCTGFSEKLTEEAAYAIGIRELIAKPVAKAVYARAIAEALEAAAANAGKRERIHPDRPASSL